MSDDLGEKLSSIPPAQQPVPATMLGPKATDPKPLRTPEIPPMKKLTTQSAMNYVRAEVETSLQMLRLEVDAPTIDRLMKDVEPIVAHAIEELDLTTLRNVRSQIASCFNRVSLGPVVRQQAPLLQNTIITTLSMLIKSV